ncbi:MAG: hypothetical protein CHACPFDD_04022 [Phycisphaerae bacterium]|nr:hypothetical protein [Phycisphaerae bacterium]
MVRLHPKRSSAHHVHYTWDSQFGFLTLRDDGTWVIRYQNNNSFFAGSAIDIPGVLTTLNAGHGQAFHVRLEGRDILGTVDLDRLNASPFGDLYLRLEQGGAVKALVGAASMLRMTWSEIPGGITSAGNLQVAEVYSHATFGYGVNIGGNVAGQFRIYEDIENGSAVSIAGNLSGELRVNRYLAGEIRINGSLIDGSYANEIRIENDILSTGAIAVDYNGWQSGDDWQSGAHVLVGGDGGAVYTSNTPSERIWEITPCKGDMNNDGSVNGFDVDPFVLALAGATGYASAYPGLAGSMVFHGDLNCDGNLNGFDVDPFTDRVIESCCLATCGSCGDGLLGGGSHDPATIADLFKDNLSEGGLGVFLNILDDMIASADSETVAEFWTIVRDLLAS